MSLDLFNTSKTFRSTLLRKLAENRIEESTAIWYHGDTTKRTSFANQKMDRDRGSQQGGNENGPGIYWTSEKAEAQGYGKFVHQARMKVAKARLLTDTTKATQKNVTALINACDKGKREEALLNWDETPARAFPQAVQAYLSMRTFADASIAIYHDIFGYDADEWAKAMVKVGYDAYQPSTRPHFVVYNPTVIDLQNQVDEASDTMSLDKYEYQPKEAAGGVVVKPEGLILLREPTNHYGGYVWTWSKGTVDKGEEIMDAAIREVQEETGVTAKVWKRLGKYLGTTSYTTMYLMTPTKITKETDKETKQVKWVTPQEAVSMIAETTTPSGRKRDLIILRDAINKHPALMDEKALRMIGNLLSPRIIE